MNCHHVKKIVCSYFNLRIEDLDRKSRKREIVLARQVAHYFVSLHYGKKREGGWQARLGHTAYKYTEGIPLKQIGREIGGKDHATVLHSIKAINNLIDTDRSFRQLIDEIDTNFSWYINCPQH